MTVANVYQRRIRTDVTRTSPFTHRPYAPAYKWGYVDGEPRWFRYANIEAEGTRG